MRAPAGLSVPTGSGPDRDPVVAVAAIQPHGFLLAVDPVTTVVEFASANLGQFVDVGAVEALGRPLVDVLGPAVTDVLPLADLRSESDTGLRTVLVPPPATTGPVVADPRGHDPWVAYEVVGHRSGRLWILEFEPAAPEPVTVRSLYDSVHRALAASGSADSVSARCASTARDVRDLTGYDRVVVYRCDTPGRGAVVAESHRGDLAGLPSTLAGLLPVSPQAARHLRLVADRDATSVSLLGRPGSASGELPDLVTAGLWAGDPRGRARLLDLDARATLTVPLAVDGVLWGYLICLHQSPRRVSHDVRAICELLGRLLLSEVYSAQRVARLGALVVEVITAMSLTGSLGAGAAAAPDALLGMVDADGVALYVDGGRVTIGWTPLPADLDTLLDRVTTLAAPADAPWATDDLAALLDQAGLGALAGSAVPAGVLFVRFGGRGSGYALWLRRTGRPWLPAEHTAAEAFANAVPALLLHRADRALAERELRARAERVTAAADLEGLEHQLQQHQRLESLGQLAGGVAHDFNNLLAVIMNYLEFIGDEVDAEASSVGGARWEAVQSDVQHVRAAAERAAELTHQLLAFARRDVVALRALDLNEVISGLESILRRTIGEQIGLEIVPDPGLHRILADPGQIEQILVNLAVNARDAMPDGGTLRIETADGAHVLLRVRDTGSGMSRETAEHVFEPFFTTKARGDGTGLGLATVHGIVRDAGGTIGIESEAGVGTTFTMVFPPTDALPEAPERRAQARPRAVGETVLLVEDADDLREIIRRLLDRAGYRVLAAADGYQALRLVADGPGTVDLLITDMIMPLMRGDEVAAKVRALYPYARVLVMSGYASPEMDDGDGSRPVYPVLEKPFSRVQLLSRVGEVLGAGRAPADVPLPG